MDSGPSREALEATFNELTHLLVTPARLTLEEVELGVGGFGEVCLATLDHSSESPKKVAVKQLRIVEASVARQRIAFRLARELKVWAKVKHPNILELIGYYLSENYVCAQLVSPFMVNGNVTQYIQRSRASVAVRLKFVLDIATGLKYLHDLNPPICHGDLKPANVLVNENLDAVLCDFGVSSFLHESGAASGLTTTMSAKGSTRYMSPELVLEEESKQTLQCDVWAWGCTAFEVMTEIIPYSNKTSKNAVLLAILLKSLPGSIDELDNLILSPDTDPASHTRLSSLRSIIPQCWDLDPTKRPSSSSIVNCIDIPVRMKPSLGVREEPGAVISSLSIPDDPSAPISAGMRKGDKSNQPRKIEDEEDDEAISARRRRPLVHALPSSDDDLEYEAMCQTCTIRPAFRGYRYCSKACARKVPKWDHPRKLNDEDEDEDEDISARMHNLSGKAPSTKVRLCIVCKKAPAVGTHSFCSKACKTEHSRAESPKAASASPNQYSQEEDPDSFEEKNSRRRPSGPAKCMSCRSKPRVGDSAFCGRTCMQIAALENISPRRSVRSRKGRESQPGQYQNLYQIVADSAQFPDSYQADWGVASRPPYQGYNQRQQGYFPPQPSYNLTQSGYPAPQPYYSQWSWPAPQWPWPAPQAPPPTSSGKPCKIMNCSGTEFAPGLKYCSKNCRKAAVNQGLEIACLMCKELPKAPKTHFCGKGCSEKAEKNAPILLDVPKTDPKFADIVKQFNDTWQGTNKMTVHRICKVVNSKAVEDRFQAYRQKVEQAGNWVSQGKTAGNENPRWHSTFRECTVGDEPNKLDMCASTSCRLCGAIRANFDMNCAAIGVYGLGIYTSAYSSTWVVPNDVAVRTRNHFEYLSRAHGYTRVATKGSPYRAMLLTQVVTGKEHIFTVGATDPNAKAPPAGYDSVAVCPKHSALVVFQSEAIRPSWLVLYS